MCKQELFTSDKDRERRSGHVVNRTKGGHRDREAGQSCGFSVNGPRSITSSNRVASYSSPLSSSMASLASSRISSIRPCSLGRDPHYFSWSRSRPEGRCLVSDQAVSTVKCRHIVCLLLTCLAVTASAEAVKSKSSYSKLTTAQPKITITQQNVSQDKTTNIPFGEDHDRDVPRDKQADVTAVVPQGSDDKSSSQTDPGLKENIYDRRQHRAVPTLYDSTLVAEKKSESFILNIFHRYRNNSNYLLKTDLEKLFVNIGLLNALNRSEVSLTAAEEEVHHHDHDSDNHHELNQNASSEDLRNVSLKTDHDRRSDTVLQGDNHADVHWKLSSIEHAQNVTTPVASYGGRQSRSLPSQQHEQHNKCLSKDQLLLLFAYEQLQQLGADEFRHLCPALIDQLDAGYCRHSVVAQDIPELKKSGEDHHDNHQHDHSHAGEEEGSHHHNDDHNHNVEGGIPEQHDHVPITVWAYAFLSVMVISLCSVAGVIVIPNMKRVFYNHILQFLVALAVGAMSGDAMLHLFPHAMLSESHHHHEANTTDSHDKSSHMDGLYKGLVALMGIYSFFFLERLFTLFTSSRSGRTDNKHKPRRRCRPQQHQQKNQAFHMVNSRLENDGGNTPSCAEMVMVVHPNKALRAYADVSHDAYLHRCDESLVQPTSGYSVTTVLSHRDDHGIKENSTVLEGVTNTDPVPWSVGRVPVLDAEILGVNKDAETVSSTHSHSHSHLAPGLVGPFSSVAMMVIVGDMIHNFCDGLAIGAAYAGNVAGGLSTSVAVFCHELPHEIGDFAVLVRSGLSMKTAVYFNLISSIPCFVGLIIGLMVGNVMSTSSWIFAGVGGMFLYVTLVDLIPEMSSVYTKCGEPWFLHLLLQASGIATGTTIMLIISIYEGTLLSAFG